jgi:uncharacterized protein with von Willebrand factor type A (vWA) domain
MRFRYVQFDPRRHGREERFRRLMDFFSRLLVNVAGDADEALEWMQSIGERHEWFDAEYSFEDFRKDLLGDGTVERQGKAFDGRPTHRLTSRGEKWLREGALNRVFTSLAPGEDGAHRTEVPGGSGDENEETRPYSWGDPVDRVAWVPTFRNAISRSAADGAPLSLREDDLEVRERESNTGCATVLLIDVSHSMVLYGEDRMFPAREIALALFQLITTRYRKDTLDLVLFGDDAVHVPLHEIPYIQAGPFHTNTKAGLRMAQSILSHRRHVNKQIFMITDGKPSAIERDGKIYKNPFGLDRMVVNRTLDEARSLRKAGITVTTFMLARDKALVEFVDEFTRLNRGRAYFTGTDRLGETLFVDYIRNRRTRI